MTGSWQITQWITWIWFTASTVERKMRHIAIMDLQAVFLPAHCNHIFYWVFLHVSICKFSLHISMNYAENDSGTARACTNTGYQALLSDFCQAPGNEANADVIFVLISLCFHVGPKCSQRLEADLQFLKLRLHCSQPYVLGYTFILHGN